MALNVHDGDTGKTHAELRFYDEGARTTTKESTRSAFSVVIRGALERKNFAIVETSNTVRPSQILWKVRG